MMAQLALLLILATVTLAAPVPSENVTTAEPEPACRDIILKCLPEFCSMDIHSAAIYIHTENLLKNQNKHPNEAIYERYPDGPLHNLCQKTCKRCPKA